MHLRCVLSLGFSGSLTQSKSANLTKLTNSFGDDKLTQRFDGHRADSNDIYIYINLYVYRIHTSMIL